MSPVRKIRLAAVFVPLSMTRTVHNVRRMVKYILYDFFVDGCKVCCLGSSRVKTGCNSLLDEGLMPEDRKKGHCMTHDHLASQYAALSALGVRISEGDKCIKVELPEIGATPDMKRATGCADAIEEMERLIWLSSSELSEDLYSDVAFKIFLITQAALCGKCIAKSDVEPPEGVITPEMVEALEASFWEWRDENKGAVLLREAPLDIEALFRRFCLVQKQFSI